jgi:diguanylate cyclase (GGDEF)-like protein
MERVLLQVTRKRDIRRLEDWLGKSYELVFPDPEHPLPEKADLVIIDGPSLRRLRSQVRAIRKAEQPVFLPFLLLTLCRRGSMPARHLGHVVDDLIIRPLNEKEVQARVANLLRMRRWSEDLKKEHDRVAKLAITDDVSGFHNTRFLHRYLDRLFNTATVKPNEVSLVFFDLDNFKSLVDAHGHLLGSKALKEVAQTVHAHLSEEDRLVRYGGDEFIVILPRQGREQALEKVERMREAITSRTFLHKEHVNARLTASFGVACYPQDAKDKHELLLEADRCLFRSKSAGKNRITATELPNAA